MSSASPLSIYESAKTDNDLIVLVFFRGHWCPICLRWLAEWSDVPNLQKQLKDLKGSILIVCSETQETVDNVIEATGLKHQDYIRGVGDVDNTIVNAIKSRQLLDVVITGEPGPFDYHGQTYPKGMVQPAVLVMKRDGSVVYSWATVPRMRNLMGALDRPAPNEIWKFAKETMSAKRSKLKLPRGKSLRYIFPKMKNVATGLSSKGKKQGAKKCQGTC